MDDAPGYAAAMAELEQILGELERADLDVDQLGAKVARAAELIRTCRDRVGAARLEVERIVADLDPEAPAT
jgi:exodeoxyribonuclease VII small subunit